MFADNNDGQLSPKNDNLDLTKYQNGVIAYADTPISENIYKQNVSTLSRQSPDNLIYLSNTAIIENTINFTNLFSDILRIVKLLLDQVE